MSAREAESTYEHLADVGDVPEGALLGVTRSDGAEICLYNHGGSIGAVGNICTHAAFLISDGTLGPDGLLECAWHGARFDCRTGEVCSGPAVDALPVFAVQVESSRVLVGRRVQ